MNTNLKNVWVKVEGRSAYNRDSRLPWHRGCTHFGVAPHEVEAAIRAVPKTPIESNAVAPLLTKVAVDDVSCF
jgi:hypothetical protein